MGQANIELMKLQTVAFEKLHIFQQLLNQEVIKKQDSKGFDLALFGKELQNSSPEGIEYNAAVEKVNKYKADNGIY